VFCGFVGHLQRKKKLEEKQGVDHIFGPAKNWGRADHSQTRIPTVRAAHKNALLVGQKTETKRCFTNFRNAYTCKRQGPKGNC